MNRKGHLFILVVLLLSIFSIYSHVYGYNIERAKILYQQALGEKSLQRKLILYKNAIKEDPRFTKAYVNLADTCEKLEKWDEAIQYYSKALEVDPEFYIAYYGKGDAYLATGQYCRAIESYDKGLVFNPNDFLALAGRTIAKQKLRICKETNGGNIIKKRELVKHLNNPLAGMETKSVTRAIRDIAIKKIRPRIGLRIYFDFNQWRLTTEAKQQLNIVAEALQSGSLKNVPMIIEGHTDNLGEESYNINLSYKRALSVKQYLCNAFDFNADLFFVKGYGESRPVDFHETNSARSLNRRVEFVRKEL